MEEVSNKSSEVLMCNRNVSKSPRSYTVGNGPKTGAGQSEHVESDDDDDDDEELSDTDEESDSRVNGQPSVIISNFHNHLSHKLASEEVDNIMKRKWKYTWKMPALNMSNCSWRGTGACFIKVLIIDHADIMLMQNWSHVNTVVEQLNRLPSKQHGTDIMRIRPWSGIFVNLHFPVLQKSTPCLISIASIIVESSHNLQIYERFDTESIAEADDARLNYFCEKVFPKIKDSIQNGVMIFISSYFEFVRVRNYLKSQAASFCLFGEYIKRNDISHVRGQFFRGEKKIMLYTGRAHFYYRYKIVNLLEESDSMNCTVLFSRLDHLRLERIVGSTAAKRMVDSEKGVFVFA
ncbi:UNVERIFIED_CONTAM: Digestive organ expansion factor [Sesamum latifolium]|uniref:Digestive organ expansion factor n=1 Tax=Sesamum latifolium TaxID=2727402 RepID=A0AAW2VB10_9LAMI